MQRPNNDSEQFWEVAAQLEAALEAKDELAADVIVQQHPQVAEQLREYLRNRHELEQLVVPLREAATAAGELPEIEGYDVLELLDSGGMGVVYRARYHRLNQVVALKMMRADCFATQEQIQRFRTEAESASRVDHKGIVSVYDIGQHNARMYYSMELVQGQSLRERLGDRGKMEPREAASLMLEIAKAMAATHREGYVHRDLKPSNVLIDRWGNPRVIDFGLAKRVGESDMTRQGDFLGTTSYTSPEQASGRADQAGPSADVHALGIILYEMLTGFPPFLAANEHETLEKIIHYDPLPVRFHEHDVEPDLEAVCMMCLRKTPDDRYRDGGQLAEDLTLISTGRRPRWARKVRMPAVEWLTEQIFHDPITAIGPMLWRFLAIYSLCLLFAQVLLLLGWAWSEPLVWLLVFSGPLPLFTVLRTDDNPNLWPANPAERTLWSIWAGVVLSSLFLFVAMRLAHSSFVTAFHQGFVIMPLLTGIAFFIMGGSFWKRNILWGIGWMMVTVIDTAFVPEPWALTSYAIFNFFVNVNIAITQRQLARSNRRQPANSPICPTEPFVEVYEEIR